MLFQTTTGTSRTLLLALALVGSLSVFVLQAESATFDRRLKQLESSVTKSLGNIIETQHDHRPEVEEFRLAELIREDLVEELKELGQVRAQAAGQVRLSAEQSAEASKRELEAFYQLHCVTAYLPVDESQTTAAPVWDAHDDDDDGGELIDLEVKSRADFTTASQAPKKLCETLQVSIKSIV